MSPVALERPVVRQNTAAQVLLNTPRWLSALPGSQTFVCSQSCGSKQTKTPDRRTIFHCVQMMSLHVQGRGKIVSECSPSLAPRRLGCWTWRPEARPLQPGQRASKSASVLDRASSGSREWSGSPKRSMCQTPRGARCLRQHATDRLTTLTISCALLPFQCDIGCLPVLWIDGGCYQI